MRSLLWKWVDINNVVDETKEESLSKLSMSITWFGNRSLLKVYGNIGKAAAADFAQTLAGATSFSSAPVVVDLTDVDSMHPRAISLMMDTMMNTANRGGPRLELLVKVPADQYGEIITDP
ncbi:hypothetical protein BH23ACT12_BH23ACT12_22300 [soil metagenome]